MAASLPHRAEVSEVLARALFELTAAYGGWLYGIKLGRVRRVEREGRAIYIKTRYRRSAFLVGAGNAVLKPLRCDLIGLPEREWLAWEQAMALIASPQEAAGQVQVLGRSLICPALPGAPLAEILRSTCSEKERLHAVELAARELRRLQRLDVRFPDGHSSTWSHGDAHAKNVLVDLSGGRATWFDFETVHAAWCPPQRRQADDLRALAYSSAAFCPPRDYAALAQVLAAAIECPRLSSELLRQSRRMQRRATAFHLAQAPLSWARHRAFGAALENALRCAPQVLGCAKKRP